MPVFYTQSSQPRTFDYLIKGSKPTLELKGNLRRIDSTKMSIGTWDGLVNMPTTC